MLHRTNRQYVFLIYLLLYILDRACGTPSTTYDTNGDCGDDQSLAPMYYRNANCAVVVYDITQSVSSDSLCGLLDENCRYHPISLTMDL